MNFRRDGTFAGIASSKRINRARRPPRGLALLIALALLAVTLGLAYALCRTQTTSLVIEENRCRQAEARQAAQAGIAVALRRMHEPDWPGISTPLSGRLDDRRSFVVSFTTGDPTLTPDHPDYDQYAFRVTLLSTGISNDLYQPSVQSAHTSRAVVQLARLPVASPPADWQALQGYTVYQWSSLPAEIQIPVRLEGAVRLQGELDLASRLPEEPPRFLQGTLDEVAVFGRALSAEQVSSIYRSSIAPGGEFRGLSEAYSANTPLHWWRLNEPAGNATAADSGSSRQDGTYEGPTTGVPGAPLVDPGSTAARLDGWNDYVDLGYLDLHDRGNPLQQVTFVAWVKMDAFTDDEVPIISKSNRSGACWRFSIVRNGNSRHLQLQLSVNGTLETVAANSNDIATGQWQFLAAAYDGRDVSLFVDGERIRKRNVSGGGLAIDPRVPASLGGSRETISPRGTYLRDLERMRAAGAGDFRPFNGPLDLPVPRTAPLTLSRVRDDMRVPVQDVPDSNAAPVAHPGPILTYRLYAGGEAYSAVTIPTTLANVQLGPHPTANPLGLFVCNGALTLGDNVTVQGTIMTNGTGSAPDLLLKGQNIRLLPLDLPPLYGDGRPLQLPVAIVKDDFRVDKPHNAQVKGMVLSWGDFELKKRRDDPELLLTGRVFASRIRFLCQDDWTHPDPWWADRLSDFFSQLTAPNPILFFPQWLGTRENLSPQPTMVVQPDTANVHYYWPDWTQPIFEPAVTGEVLRWEVVQWKDRG